MSASSDYEPLRSALALEYTLELVLEESADEAVYLATDRMLGRPVLIRAVDPASAGDAGTEAFLREARILASLSHPGIPAVHHAGPIEQYFHIVLEHTAGETLEARLLAGPLERDTVIYLGEQLLDAVSAIHGAGLAHHEIEPRHVVMARGRYLLDGFGSAGPVDAPDAVVGDLHAVAVLLAEAAGEQK